MAEIWGIEQIEPRRVRDFFPHIVPLRHLNNDQLRAARQWLHDTHGPSGMRGRDKTGTPIIVPESRWAASITNFYFVSPADAFEFKLRWG